MNSYSERRLPKDYVGRKNDCTIASEHVSNMDYIRYNRTVIQIDLSLAKRFRKRKLEDKRMYQIEQTH